MALSNAETLRFYLRDREQPGVFRDDEIDRLLADTSSVEEAAAVGWLLKAGMASDAPSTITMGLTTERYGTVSETYAQAIAQHKFWLTRSGQGLARFFEALPGKDDELITYLVDINRYVEENVSTYNVTKDL